MNTPMALALAAVIIVAPHVPRWFALSVVWVLGIASIVISSGMVR